MLRIQLDCYDCPTFKSTKQFRIFKGVFNNMGNSWGVGGPHRPSGTEIPGEEGGAKQKAFRGGYGYFLELHIL